MQTKIVSESSDAFISLIELVKLRYCPVSTRRKCGKQPDFSDLSFLLLAVAAVVLRTFSDSALRRLLEADEELLRTCEFSRVAHRTSIGRRLKIFLPQAETQVSLFGKEILKQIEIPPAASQTSATDGRMYQAVGPLWHKKDRQQIKIPNRLRNVDTESSWSKSGHRGWV